MEFLSELWEILERALDNPFIRIVSLVASPLLALLAFIWNRRDRKEIIEKSVELGRLENEVENAHASNRDNQQELQVATEELGRRGGEIAKLEADLRKITDSSQSLWNLRPHVSFDEYRARLWDPTGAKIITIGNLKGGVGKTTLAANFAAYISETLKEPVLLIDLDYQGSLSNMLMLAIEREEVASNVDRLFEPGANLATLDEASVHLVPKLSQGWLVPASYEFARVENRLLLNWLLQSDGGVDVRHRLANVLLRPEVRRRYKAIILDMPPRMTLGSVNALVTSHHFVVPTVLDKLSAEAVSQFVTNVKQIKNDLGLVIELAGIVGCMTREQSPKGNESAALELARAGGFQWSQDEDYLFKTTLPRKVAIGNAAGEDIAYFLKDAERLPLRNVFDPLFEEICAKIFPRN